jgi:probable rRNA maturation factor
MPAASPASPRLAPVAPPAVELVVKDAGWRKIFPDPEGAARTILTAALADPAVRKRIPPGAVALSLCLSGDREVRDLNFRYRGKDAPTNVLAFPSAEAGLQGDVVLALGVVEDEAKTQGKRPADHARHLLLHGLLHLAGFTHRHDEEAAEMERVETRILKTLGIADPYRTVED